MKSTSSRLPTRSYSAMALPGKLFFWIWDVSAVPMNPVGQKIKDIMRDWKGDVKFGFVYNPNYGFRLKS